MDENSKNAITFDCFDFLIWNGCKDLLSNYSTERLKNIEQLCDFSNVYLQSSSWNEAYKSRQVKLIKLLKNLYNGQSIISKENEIPLEKVISDVNDLKKELPQFTRELTDLEFQLKIGAVILCCKENEFELGMHVFNRQGLNLSDHMRLRDEQELLSVERILCNKKADSKVLKNFDYSSFIKNCFSTLQLIFNTIPEPRLTQLYQNKKNLKLITNVDPAIGNNNYNAEKKIASTSKNGTKINEDEFKNKFDECQLESVEISKESKELLFQISKYMIRKGTLSEATKLKILNKVPEEVVQVDGLFSKIKARLKRLGIIDMFAVSAEVENEYSEMKTSNSASVASTVHGKNHENTFFASSNQSKKELKRAYGDDYNSPRKSMRIASTMAQTSVFEISPSKSAKKAPATKSPKKLHSKSSKKSSTKTLTKLPTQSPKKTPLKSSTNSPTKSPRKSSPKSITKSLAETPTKSSIKPLTRSATKSPTKLSTKSLPNSPRSSVRTCRRSENFQRSSNRETRRKTKSSVGTASDFPQHNVPLSQFIPRRTSSTFTPKPANQELPNHRPSPQSRVQKKNLWSRFEEINLYTGVQKHGHNWKTILLEYDFNNRTNIDLSDKWRNINKNRKLKRLLQNRYLESLKEKFKKVD